MRAELRSDRIVYTSSFQQYLRQIGIPLLFLFILNVASIGLGFSQIPYWHECYPTNASDSQQNLNVGDPISASSGEYHFTMRLFDLGGILPLKLDMYYGSVGTTKRFYGLPGPFLLSHRLLVQANKITEPPSLFVEKGMGEEIGFHHTNEGWVPYDLEAVRYQLRETRDHYYLMDPVEELVYTFRKEYENDETVIALITTIRDRNGNTLSYEYPQDGGATGFDHIHGGPTEVADGLGRKLRFFYELFGADPARRHPYITRIEDQTGRAWTLNYDVPASDNPSVEHGVTLRSFTDPLGGVTTFKYADFDRITSVERALGNTPYVQAYNPAYADRGVVEYQTDAYGYTTHLTADQFESRTDVVRYKGRDVGMRRVGEESQFTITYPDGTQRVYEHTHGSRVAETLTDQVGNQVIFHSDPTRHRVTEVTDRLGDTTEITYHEASGKIASCTDADGNTSTFAYEPQDQRFGPVTFTFYNLMRVEHPDGSLEELAYDAKGRVTSYTDRAGKTWRNEYNTWGQMTEVSNPTGGKLEYEYNADGTLSSSTDSDAGTITYRYDAYRRPNQITWADGSGVKLAYDANDRLLTLTDESGNTTTFTYDVNGNLVMTCDPMGRTYTYTWDLMDRLRARADPVHQVNDYAYDERDRLQTCIDRNGNTTTYGYDELGWLTSVTDPLHHTWAIAYDAEGVPRAVTTPLGHTTSFQTDGLAHTTSITDPLGAVSRFSYDKMGRLTDRTDRMGRSTEYDYDIGGRLVRVAKTAMGGADYFWNDLGLVSRVTDLRGESWDLKYSPMGRLVSHTDPLGNQWTYEYDNRGRLNQTVYPDGESASFTYDAANRPTQIAYSDGLRLNYAFDNAGRLVETEDLTLTYDARGDVINSQSGGASFGATYDDGRNVRTMTYDGRATVTYSHDARDQLSRVEDDLSGAWMEFGYDAAGRLTRVRRSNGVVTEYTYDDASRVIRIQDGTIGDQRHALNAEGEPTRVSMYAPLFNGTITYAYDDGGRLIGVDRGSGDRMDYTYDAAGNLLRAHGLTPAKDSPTGGDYTYNSASQLSGRGYVYDAYGRQVESPTKALSYDGAGRLVSVSADGDEVAFAHNGLGDLRTRRADSTATTYYYNYALGIGFIVAERIGIPSSSGGGAAANGYKRFYVYTPGGSLLYSIDPASRDVHFYHSDRLGSTLFLTNRAGTVTDAYAYDPYGRVLHHTGDSDQPFTFVGGYGVRYEPVGALYDMRARMYNPATARFLTRDPVWPALAEPQSLNPYQYAMQNPQRYVDPHGTNILTTLGKVVIRGSIDYLVDAGAELLFGASIPMGLGFVLHTSDANVGSELYTPEQVEAQQAAHAREVQQRGMAIGRQIHTDYLSGSSYYEVVPDTYFRHRPVMRSHRYPDVKFILRGGSGGIIIYSTRLLDDDRKRPFALGRPMTISHSVVDWDLWTKRQHEVNAALKVQRLARYQEEAFASFQTVILNADDLEQYWDFLMSSARESTTKISER